jgi:hypothetical protein
VNKKLQNNPQINEKTSETKKTILKKQENLNCKPMIVVATPFAHIFLPFFVTNNFSPIIFSMYHKKISFSFILKIKCSRANFGIGIHSKVMFS